MEKGKGWMVMETGEERELKRAELGIGEREQEECRKGSWRRQNKGMEKGKGVNGEERRTSKGILKRA